MYHTEKPNAISFSAFSPPFFTPALLHKASIIIILIILYLFRYVNACVFVLRKFYFFHYFKDTSVFC